MFKRAILDMNIPRYGKQITHNPYEKCVKSELVQTGIKYSRDYSEIATITVIYYVINSEIVRDCI